MKDYMLQVTEAEVNIIGQILAEGPYKIVAPLIVKLQQQVNEQNTPAPRELVSGEPAVPC